MSHTADIAQHREARGVERARLGKGVAYVSPDEGTRSLWVLSEFLTYKVPSQQTGGAYSLFEATSHPGSGPPPHINHREDESFYVLEGEYEFLIDGQIVKAGAGSLLYVPKGTLHAHRNLGEGVGRMLVTQTPGGLYERFFEEVGQEAKGNVVVASLEEGSPEAVGIAEIAARYGIEIDLPAGQASKNNLLVSQRKVPTAAPAPNAGRPPSTAIPSTDRATTAQAPASDGS